MYIVPPLWLVGSSVKIQREAGNFRGKNLKSVIFNFVILYRIIYNFREFNFRESQKIAKIVKVIIY